jgi:hypothetical protein
MKPEDPIRVEDFTKISPLAKAYELKPGVTYLILGDGKFFNRDGLNALLRHVEQFHPELHICIIETLHPKGLEVRANEKEADRTTDTLPATE